MDALIFNQASIFHLQQLEFQYRKKFGKHHRLSNEASRNELINESSISPDRVIQKYFRQFCHELEPALIEELVMRGVVKPSEIKH